DTSETSETSETNLMGNALGGSHHTSAHGEQDGIGGGVTHKHTRRCLFQDHACVSYPLCHVIQLGCVRQTHVKVAQPDRSWWGRLCIDALPGVETHMTVIPTCRDEQRLRSVPRYNVEP